MNMLSRRRRDNWAPVKGCPRPKGEAPLRQIAKDFGVSEGCLHRWLKIADREDGVVRDGRQNPGDESAELRELKKRNRLLELQFYLRSCMDYRALRLLPHVGAHEESAMALVSPGDGDDEPTPRGTCAGLYHALCGADPAVYVLTVLPCRNAPLLHDAHALATLHRLLVCCVSFSGVRRMQGVQSLLGTLPLMGICLGHQVIGRALGAETFKLKFGHRGANHPVKDLRSGRVYITSQNHGYALRQEGLVDGAIVSHVNLHDGTVAGLTHRDYPVISIQYHSEASPGPLDNGYLFDEFLELIRVRQTSGRQNSRRDKGGT